MGWSAPGIAIVALQHCATLCTWFVVMGVCGGGGGSVKQLGVYTKKICGDITSKAGLRHKLVPFYPDGSCLGRCMACIAEAAAGTLQATVQRCHV